ncbi:hypothetical protein [Plebeiibacterium sediminum]|uniref:Glycosyltransferase RgtA/B/C/D-like domain-containing protein n=1 Tax=Plebeiibacterium sediminum TaxID=2992112 RepID=A0AAE3M1P8_9BACT|nr:hypothetical protein [Plebeiobacterium sediminum]MCW3785519.1 hypothetical protein [Plebeiobacterium sediminum]
MKNYIPFGFLIVISIFLHSMSIDKMPMSAFAWAHADHYALAQGFLDNGFDFFHPKTFSLNPGLPPEKELANPQGITASDFPLLHYVVAIAFKLTGQVSPIVYRIIVLLWSLVCFFMLFKSILYFKGKIYAFLICSFVFLQPCYSFYQDNFHVCATAYNTFVLGLSYLLHYFNNNSYKKKFYLGIIFLTLAALMRFIQIIPIIAILCTFIVQSIRNRKFEIKILTCLISLFCVVSYFIYNQFLARKYGSVFMNAPDFVKNLHEVYFYMKQILLVYPRLVLPPAHFIVIIALIVLFFKQTTMDKLMKPLFLWMMLNAIGALLFTILMLENVSVHEYYSIDVWLPVITLLLIYLLFTIDLTTLKKSKVVLFISVTFLAGLFIASRSQYKRYDSVFSNVLNGGEDKIIQTFKDSKSYLDNMLSEDQKVLIICESGRNIPQVGWPRDVYRIGGNTFEYYNKIMDKKYDAIVTYNATFNEKLLKFHPEFLSSVDFVNSNGKVTIWKHKGMIN